LFLVVAQFWLCLQSKVVLFKVGLQNHQVDNSMLRWWLAGFRFVTGLLLVVVLVYCSTLLSGKNI